MADVGAVVLHTPGEPPEVRSVPALKYLPRASADGKKRAMADAAALLREELS